MAMINAFIWAFLKQWSVSMDDKYFTPSGLAEYLGVQLSTIYNWTHIKYIPHVKIGKLLRFRKDSIDEWLQRQERKGRSRIKRSASLDSTQI
jgi:excisionase family DNA binding protein